MLPRATEVRPHAGARADKEEAGDILRIGRGVVLRQESAVRETDQNPLVDSYSCPDSLEIVDRLLYGVAVFTGLVVGQAGAALVVVDDAREAMRDRATGGSSGEFRRALR